MENLWGDSEARKQKKKTPSLHHVRGRVVMGIKNRQRKRSPAGFLTTATAKGTSAAIFISMLDYGGGLLAELGRVLEEPIRWKIRCLKELCSLGRSNQSCARSEPTITNPIEELLPISRLLLECYLRKALGALGMGVIEPDVHHNSCLFTGRCTGKA